MKELFLEFTLSSDTWSPAHPRIAAAMAEASVGFAPAYGADELSQRAAGRIREVLEAPEVFFVLNGTGANVLALSALMERGSGVVCPASAHINNHETGAPEHILGAKLLACPRPDGKLRPEDITRWAAQRGNPHLVSPDVVSLSQSTELGTLYTPEEVEALCSEAHRHGMAVHMDGARFANAVAALGCTPAAACKGVDVLCFGGTKNGFMFGEALVFLNPEKAGRFAYLQKQQLQLASKNRYVAAQFDEALRDGLWLEMAGNACRTAARLAAGLKKLPGLQFTVEPQSNQLFFTVPESWLEPMQKLTDYDYEDGAVRLVCSWNTTDEMVDSFLEKMGELV